MTDKESFAELVKKLDRGQYDPALSHQWPVC
jgi:hypothetical protein